MICGAVSAKPATPSEPMLALSNQDELISGVLLLSGTAQQSGQDALKLSETPNGQ